MNQPYITSDDGTGSDGDVPEDGGSGVDDHVVFDCRMAFQFRSAIDLAGLKAPKVTPW